jgi:hypothetical protein
MVIVMVSSSDTTTTVENTDPEDDKLIFVNGREQLKYLRGQREHQRNKNKLGSIIEYVRNLIKF